MVIHFLICGHCVMVNPCVGRNDGGIFIAFHVIGSAWISIGIANAVISNPFVPCM